MPKLNNVLVLTVVVAVALNIDAVKAHNEATTASLKFGVDLYTASLAENPNKNVIVSPLSVQTALGLLLMGAGGTTAEQIVSGLSLQTSDRSNLLSYFQEILGRYDGQDNLKIANKVYVDEDYQLNPQFSEVAKKQFGSEAESINFRDGNAAANINSWVEDKTNGKIKDPVSAGSLTEDTRMVLVNAVHFKAAWDEEFQKRLTQKRDFWISETESVKVDTMRGHIDVQLCQSWDLDAKIVVIPYRDTKLAMVIFLPNSRTGLQDMEYKLQTFDFDSPCFDMKHKVNADVFLPKFRVESNVNLKSVFAKMGMVDMFTNAASFPSLIDSSMRLKVDEAVHKAYICVDEEGTEAAAATVVKVVSFSMPPTIQIDHPFLFAIMNAHDVAFIGSVRNL